MLETTSNRKSLLAFLLPLLLVLSLAGFPAACQDLPSSASAPQSFTLDVYALRGPQDQSAKLYLSVLPRDAQTAAPDELKEVQVKVAGTDGQLEGTNNYMDVYSPAGQAVIDLGDVPLLDSVSVQVLVQTNQTVNTEVLNGMTAVTEFALNSRQVIVPDFEGYGAQMNSNLYTSLSNAAKGWINYPPEDVGNVETKVQNMKPGLCRIFLSPKNYIPGNENLMNSFYKTVDLAQQAGATVNITWWYIERAPKDDPVMQQTLIEKDMREFADTLLDLVKNHGLTTVQQITIQNEVNTTWVPQSLYEQCYRLLDQYLRNAGLRDQIKFVGGDLVLNHQLIWFNYMAAHMGDVLDGWSVHIYWNYWDPAYFQYRLNGILSIYNNIPPEERKPLSITEYGVRGIKNLNGTPIKVPDPYRNGALVNIDPGVYVDANGNSTPVSETNIVGFEQAWFNMLSVNKSFTGLAKWDFYRAQYDFGYQDYSLIGYLFNPAPGEDQWPLRPAYYMEWLMANTTGQHWQALGYHGSSGAKLVTPFRGPSGDLTLFALSANQAAASFSVGDLPANTDFKVLIWNADGSGKVTSDGNVNSDATGTVAVDAPAQSLVALTTVTTGQMP